MNSEIVIYVGQFDVVYFSKWIKKHGRRFKRRSG